MSSSEGSSSSDWSDEDEDIVCRQTPALFGDHEVSFASAEECIKSAKSDHGFDLEVLRRRHAMDCFSFFRLVNFIRLEKPKASEIMDMKDDSAWQDQKYLQPTLADDPLLTLDFEGDDDDDDMKASGDLSADLAKVQLEQEEKVVLSKDQLSELEKQLKGLRAALLTKESELETCLLKMEAMRATLTRNLDLDIPESDDIETEKELSKKKILPSIRHKDDDAGYALSYAHYGIHHEMLSDSVRTLAYKDAIAKNAKLFSGKRVLDVGCGTSILSMFSCSCADASKVVAVDMSKIICQAHDIVRENGLEDRIELRRGRIEDLDFPEKEKFDLVISEWMGYFLLFEGMLDSVIYARDNLLSTSGRLLPNRCTLHLVGVEDMAKRRQFLHFWEDVYGFKMSCMKEPVLKEPAIEVVDDEHVVTDPVTICDLNLETCSLEDTQFVAQFVMQAKRDAEITAMAGYFDTFFELENEVSFTTGPGGEATHWKQTVFYLKDVVTVAKGQEVSGYIEVTRPASDPRGLIVKICLDGKAPQEFVIE